MAYWAVAQLQPQCERLALHTLTLAGYTTYLPRLRQRRMSFGERNFHFHERSVVAKRNALDQIGGADKIRHEGVDGVCIDGVRVPNLLDYTLVHDYDSIAHDESLGLIVRDVDRRDADLFLQPRKL